MGCDQPVPSVRLKSQRRGLQDYEHFWLLAGKTGGDKAASDSIVNRIVYKHPFGAEAMLDTEVWRRDPEEWEKARIEAGGAISAR